MTEREADTVAGHQVALRHPRVVLGGAYSTAERRHRSRYCGPAVVAALTGCSTMVAAEMILQSHGNPRQKWCHVRDLVAAVQRCGYTVTDHLPFDAGAPPELDADEQPGDHEWTGFCDEVSYELTMPSTLAEFLSGKFRDMRHRRPAWIVAVTRHFVAVAGDWFVDSSHREPTRIDDVVGTQALGSALGVSVCGMLSVTRGRA